MTAFRTDFQVGKIELQLEKPEGEIERLRTLVDLLQLEVLKLRNALAQISLNENESMSSASEKVRSNARIARKALYGDKP